MKGFHAKNATFTTHDLEHGKIAENGSVVNFLVVKILCRSNYWYITIYNLWLNTVLNIVLPIASLVILNILIFRYVV